MVVSVILVHPFFFLAKEKQKDKKENKSFCYKGLN